MLVITRGWLRPSPAIPGLWSRRSRRDILGENGARKPRHPHWRGKLNIRRKGMLRTPIKIIKPGKKELPLGFVASVSGFNDCLSSVRVKWPTPTAFLWRQMWFPGPCDHLGYAESGSKSGCPEEWMVSNGLLRKLWSWLIHSSLIFHDLCCVLWWTCAKDMFFLAAQR